MQFLAKTLSRYAAGLADRGRFEAAEVVISAAKWISPSSETARAHENRIQHLKVYSTDPKCQAETRKMLHIIDTMSHELERDPLYVPSKLWAKINSAHTELLSQYGIDHFKRTVSHQYQNWFMTSLDDPQTKRIFQIWDRNRNSDPLFTEIESPGHVGFHATDGTGNTEYVLAQREPREIYRMAVSILWEHVLNTDTTGTLARMEESEIGNPIRIRRHGKLISSDLAHSVRERNVLFDACSLDGSEKLTVSELGAGHGRLAEVIGRTTNYRYFIFDIAPALYVSQWYIKKVFPNERVFEFRPFQDFSEVKDELSVSRFAFFTANQIELLPDNYVDCFINMNSLMEMRKEQIKNFLHHIDRLTKIAFLSRQWLKWRNTFDGITVAESDFRLPGRWKKIVDVVDDIYPEFFNHVWHRSLENR